METKEIKQSNLKKVSPQTTDFSVADSGDTATENCESAENHSEDVVLPKTSDTSTQTEDTSNSNVPNWLVPSLIENIRCNTQLSHENSKNAIGVIIDTFAEALPNLNSMWCQIKEDLKKFEVIQVIIFFFLLLLKSVFFFF